MSQLDSSSLLLQENLGHGGHSFVVNSTRFNSNSTLAMANNLNSSSLIKINHSYDIKKLSGLYGPYNDYVAHFKQQDRLVHAPHYNSVLIRKLDHELNKLELLDTPPKKKSKRKRHRDGQSNESKPTAAAVTNTAAGKVKNQSFLPRINNAKLKASKVSHEPGEKMAKTAAFILDLNRSSNNKSEEKSSVPPVASSSISTCSTSSVEKNAGLGRIISHLKAEKPSSRLHYKNLEIENNMESKRSRRMHGGKNAQKLSVDDLITYRHPKAGFDESSQLLESIHNFELLNDHPPPAIRREEKSNSMQLVPVPTVTISTTLTIPRLPPSHRRFLMVFGQQNGAEDDRKVTNKKSENRDSSQLPHRIDGRFRLRPLESTKKRNYAKSNFPAILDSFQIEKIEMPETETDQEHKDPPVKVMDTKTSECKPKLKTQQPIKAIGVPKMSTTVKKKKNDSYVDMSGFYDVMASSVELNTDYPIRVDSPHKLGKSAADYEAYTSSTMHFNQKLNNHFEMFQSKRAAALLVQPELPTINSEKA